MIWVLTPWHPAEKPISHTLPTWKPPAWSDAQDTVSCQSATPPSPTRS